MIKYFILVAALLITLPFWLPTSLGGDTSYHFVLTDSMKGSLGPGSFVILRASDNYQVGQAVGYKLDLANDESAIILHRIIGREPDGTYILKGDAVESTERVQEEAITGRTVFAVPALGFLPGAFRAAPMLIGGLLLTMVFLSRGSKKKDKAKDKDKATAKKGFRAKNRQVAGVKTTSKADNLFIPAALLVLLAIPFATTAMTDILPPFVTANMMGSLLSGVPLFMILIGVLAVTRLGEVYWIRGSGGGSVAEVNYGLVMILAVSVIPLTQFIESARSVFSF